MFRANITTIVIHIQFVRDEVLIKIISSTS